MGSMWGLSEDEHWVHRAAHTREDTRCSPGANHGEISMHVSNQACGCRTARLQKKKGSQQMPRAAIN